MSTPSLWERPEQPNVFFWSELVHVRRVRFPLQIGGGLFPHLQICCYDSAVHICQCLFMLGQRLFCPEPPEATYVTTKSTMASTQKAYFYLRQLDQTRHVVILGAFFLTPHSFLKSLTPSNSALWQKCSLYFNRYMPTLNRAQKALGHAGLLFKTKALKDDNIVKLRPKVELVNTPKFFLHALMLPTHSNSQDQCVRSGRRE